jgi:hypothetical protein
MVSTRSKQSSENVDTGAKRAAPAPAAKSNKKAKKEDGKLEVGDDGQVGLKDESSGDKKEAGDQNSEAQDGAAADSKEESSNSKDDTTSKPKAEYKPKAGEDMDKTRDEMKAEEGEKAEKGEDEVDEKALEGTKEELDEPKHGT